MITLQVITIVTHCVLAAINCFFLKRHLPSIRTKNTDNYLVWLQLGATTIMFVLITVTLEPYIFLVYASGYIGWILGKKKDEGGIVKLEYENLIEPEKVTR
jgi:hypothetical protein